jgi:cytochrome d ubiquinol oxidase subunit I
VAAIYVVLTVLTVWVLRRLAHTHGTAAPQEADQPWPERQAAEVTAQ